MKKTTDEDLIKQVGNNNMDAYQLLYQRYEKPIYHFILRYTGNRELAQDLFQETFVRVWYSARTFDKNRGKFKGWVYKIALNLTRNEMIKKHYRQNFIDIDTCPGLISHDAGHSNHPERQVEQKELKREILNELNKLSPDLKDIVVLKFFEQLKFREIAEITNTPEGTLKARLHRAIHQLKGRLSCL